MVLWMLGRSRLFRCGNRASRQGRAACVICPLQLLRSSQEGRGLVTQSERRAGAGKVLVQAAVVVAGELFLE
jgi:hypothetical protein